MVMNDIFKFPKPRTYTLENDHCNGINTLEKNTENMDKSVKH